MDRLWLIKTKIVFLINMLRRYAGEVDVFDFDNCIMRHGEYLVQAIVDGWERHIGLCPAYETPLKERWDRFIRETDQFLVRPVA